MEESSFSRSQMSLREKLWHVHWLFVLLVCAVAGIEAGRLDALHPRHADIQEYDVGFELGGKSQRFLAVAGLADDIVAGFVFENLAEPIPCRLFVVDDEHFHEVSSSIGNRSVTVYWSLLSSRVTLARLP